VWDDEPLRPSQFRKILEASLINAEPALELRERFTVVTPARGICGDKSAIPQPA
jgi:hypothetical protein